MERGKKGKHPSGMIVGKTFCLFFVWELVALVVVKAQNVSQSSTGANSSSPSSMTSFDELPIDMVQRPLHHLEAAFAIVLVSVLSSLFLGIAQAPMVAARAAMVLIVILGSCNYTHSAHSPSYFQYPLQASLDGNIQYGSLILSTILLFLFFVVAQGPLLAAKVCLPIDNVVLMEKMSNFYRQYMTRFHATVLCYLMPSMFHTVTIIALEQKGNMGILFLVFACILVSLVPVLLALIRIAQPLSSIFLTLRRGIRGEIDDEEGEHFEDASVASTQDFRRGGGRKARHGMLPMSTHYAPRRRVATQRDDDEEGQTEGGTEVCSSINTNGSEFVEANDGGGSTVVTHQTGYRTLTASVMTTGSSMLSHLDEESTILSSLSSSALSHTQASSEQASSSGRGNASSSQQGSSSVVTSSSASVSTAVESTAVNTHTTLSLNLPASAVASTVDILHLQAEKLEAKAVEEKRKLEEKERKMLEQRLKSFEFAYQNLTPASMMRESYGVYFELCRAPENALVRCYWFVEMILYCLASIGAGFSFSSAEQQCRPLGSVMTSVSLFLLLVYLTFVRPYQAGFDNTFAILSTVLLLLLSASTLVVVVTGTTDVNWNSLQQLLTLIAYLFYFLQLGMFVMFYSKSACWRPWDRVADMEAPPSWKSRSNPESSSSSAFVAEYLDADGEWKLWERKQKSDVISRLLTAPLLQEDDEVSVEAELEIFEKEEATKRVEEEKHRENEMVEKRLEIAQQEKENPLEAMEPASFVSLGAPLYDHRKAVAENARRCAQIETELAYRKARQEEKQTQEQKLNEVMSMLSRSVGCHESSKSFALDIGRGRFPVWSSRPAHNLNDNLVAASRPIPNASDYWLTELDRLARDSRAAHEESKEDSESEWLCRMGQRFQQRSARPPPVSILKKSNGKGVVGRTQNLIQAADKVLHQSAMMDAEEEEELRAAEQQITSIPSNEARPSQQPGNNDFDFSL